MIEVRLVTAQELADFLKIHRESVYYLIRRGDIKGAKVRNKWLFDPDQVLASLQVQARVGGGEGGGFNGSGYDGNEAGETAIGNADGGAVSDDGTGGAHYGDRRSFTADLGRPS